MRTYKIHPGDLLDEFSRKPDFQMLENGLSMNNFVHHGPADADERQTVLGGILQQFDASDGSSFADLDRWVEKFYYRGQQIARDANVYVVRVGTQVVFLFDEKKLGLLRKLIQKLLDREMAQAVNRLQSAVDWVLTMGLTVDDINRLVNEQLVRSVQTS